MKQSYQFMKIKVFSAIIVFSFFCLLVSAIAQEYWIPPTGGGFGEGTSGIAVGSAIQAEKQVATIGNRIVFYYGINLPPGATRGEPDILVPMLDRDGKPIVVPISQVTTVIEQGGSAPDGLVIMHDPATGMNFAVKAEQVADYTSRGFLLSSKEPTQEGVVMCLDGVTVVVPKLGLESFKKNHPTATSGPCKKQKRE